MLGSYYKASKAITTMIFLFWLTSSSKTTISLQLSLGWCWCLLQLSSTQGTWHVMFMLTLCVGKFLRWLNR